VAASSAPRILLADDEVDLLQLLSELLSSAGYRVEAVADGKIALERAAGEVFDLVVADYKMPGLDGLEVLKGIRARRKPQKMLLLTGYATEELAREAGLLGCRVLSKPIDRDRLLEAIAEELAAVEGLDPAKYARVPLEEFIVGADMGFPVFVQLSGGRFLKLAHAARDLAPERVAQFRAKGVSELWLERADFQKYTQLSVSLARAAAARPQLGERRRARLIRHACEVAYENVRLMGVTEVTFDAGRRVFESSLRGFLTNAMAVAALETLESRGTALYAHGASGGLLSATVARVMEWSSPKNVSNLTLGAFLHDVGLSGTNWPAVPRAEGAPEPPELEQPAYQRHPTLGAELLRRIPSVPREVVTIVLQHHENANGGGFPSGLKRTEIFPMARIVSAVDQFIDELSKLGPGGIPRAPEVLQEMMLRDDGSLDMATMLALHLTITCPNLDQARQDFRVKAGKYGV
jgi:two-component system response regulator (stage 0 sporulation protein F)